MDDRAARVALTSLAEPGNRTIWAMVQEDGAPAALDRLLTGDVPNAALRTAVRSKALGGDPRRLAEAALNRVHRLGTRIVVPSDPEWPTRVDTLASLELDAGGSINRDVRPPLCFWVRGDGSLGEWLDRSVAIVGARAASDYGRHVATELAYGVAAEGWTVVSGGAAVL